MVKKTVNKFLIITWLFLSTASLFSQVNIKGKLLSKQDSLPVVNAYVLLKDIKSNKMVTYYISNEKGEFFLDTNSDKGIFLLKIHHQSFQPVEKPILIKNIKKNIKLTFYLEEKQNQLDEVVIKSLPPIVVKKDTVIYNVKRFAKKSDASLEDVLKKIDDFEVSEDGTLKIKGKKVDKVLIDGKEISDEGHAVLTRSIDPKKIEKIEVRFKEKDRKLKNSLLGKTDLVILDIKLKKDLENPLFGRVKGTIGYQKNFTGGFYFNSFYLKKKIKTHVFSEYDDFGHQTISLISIKNLGEEALKNLFDRPADFDDFRQREGFFEEIYGFRNYTASKKRMLGFTTRLDINKNFYVLIGSYNFINDLKKVSTNKQIIVNDYDYISETGDYKKIKTTKNKIDFRYDTDKIKLRYNANYVYKDNYNDIKTDINIDLFNNFIQADYESKWYHNLRFEYLFNENFGLGLKSSFADENFLQKIELQHNNRQIAELLRDDKGNLTNNFYQKNNFELKDFYNTIYSSFQKNNHFINLFFTYNYRLLNYFQFAKNTETQFFISNFNTNTNTYSYTEFHPGVSYSFVKEKYNFSFGLKNVFYKLTDNKYNSNFNYNAQFDYQTLGFRISLNYNNRLSKFPLSKQITINRLIDNNLIFISNPNIKVYNEDTFEVSLSKDFNILALDFAWLRGNNKTKDKFSYSDYFLFKQPDNLKATYNLVSFVLKRKFGNIKIIIEPEYMQNVQDNYLNNKVYSLKSEFYLLGIKLKSLNKKNKFNFYLYPKITNIIYSNDLSETTNNQFMFSNKLNINYEILKNKLYFITDYRLVSFTGLSETYYNNFGFKVRGNWKKINYQFELSNLFNDKNFITTFQQPLQLSVQTNRIFERYFQFAVEYSF